MKLYPFHSDSKVNCSQCHTKKPRTGSIKVAVGTHHYRVVCSDCNEKNNYVKIEEDDLYVERRA
jgi:cytochrome c peroxidase